MNHILAEFGTGSAGGISVAQSIMNWIGSAIAAAVGVQSIKYASDQRAKALARTNADLATTARKEARLDAESLMGITSDVVGMQREQINQLIDQGKTMLASAASEREHNAAQIADLKAINASEREHNAAQIAQLKAINAEQAKQIKTLTRALTLEQKAHAETKAKLHARATAEKTQTA